MINVKNALVFRKDGSSYIKNMPKTAAGFRSIPIPPPLKKILSVYLDTLTFANPYLFTQQKTGRLHTKSSYTKMTARIRLALNAAAGGLNRVNPVTHRREIAINMIDGLTDHTFRHNYATRLHAAGVPVKSAQYLLGHESVETTLRIYTHLDRGSISHDMIDGIFDDTSDDTAAVKTS
jgi:integrase